MRFNSYVKFTGSYVMALCIVSVLCSCGFFEKKKNAESSEEQISATEDADGVATAQVSSKSLTAQTVKTSESGPLAGSSLTLPPGSLSLDVSISIQEVSTLANQTSTEILGVTNTFTAAGPAIIFKPSTATESLVPMALSIPLSKASLALQSTGENLAVIFLATGVKDGVSQNYMGLIPAAELKIGSKSVSFQTTRFGAFQVIKTATKIEATVQVATSIAPAGKALLNAPHLGMWKSNCTVDSETNSTNLAQTGSKRSEFNFNKDTLNVREILFSDGNCASIVESSTIRATYALAGDSVSVSGAKNLDVTISEVFLRLHTQERVDQANQEGICGTKNWLLKVEQEINTANCRSDANNSNDKGPPAKGTTIYTLMHVSADTMRIGANDGKTPETRATELESAEDGKTRVK